MISWRGSTCWKPQQDKSHLTPHLPTFTMDVRKEGTYIHRHLHMEACTGSGVPPPPTKAYIFRLLQFRNWHSTTSDDYFRLCLAEHLTQYSAVFHSAMVVEMIITNPERSKFSLVSSLVGLFLQFQIISGPLKWQWINLCQRICLQKHLDQRGYLQGRYSGQVEDALTTQHFSYVTLAAPHTHLIICTNF